MWMAGEVKSERNGKGVWVVTFDEVKGNRDTMGTWMTTDVDKE